MQSIVEQSVIKQYISFEMIIILIKILRTNACEAREYFFCYARMYSGNSVRLNKTKIRWRGIFLEVLCRF